MLVHDSRHVLGGGQREDDELRLREGVAERRHGFDAARRRLVEARLREIEAEGAETLRRQRLGHADAHGPRPTTATVVGFASLMPASSWIVGAQNARGSWKERGSPASSMRFQDVLGRR